MLQKYSKKKYVDMQIEQIYFLADEKDSADMEPEVPGNLLI